MTDIFNALFDFFELIKNTVISLIEGLVVFFDSLSVLSSATTNLEVWMPGALIPIVSLCFFMAIFLRVVGR